MKLYENIRARRIALKMTQQELAAKLGYKSTSTIAKIESGENDIPQSKIVAFARALETTPGATRKIPTDLMLREGISQGRVFAGMTMPEYERFVKKAMQAPAEGLKNLRHGDAFYLPMVEVLSYLRANRFKTFIVSASDRQTVRILVDGALPVDMDNIIGTDIFHVASHQAGTPSPDYTFTQDDEILRGGFASFNMKMNKVANIVREIGKQPVQAFGNSSGDAGMFNYTITRNKHKALAFSLLCDDLVRELGSKEKSEKMRAACEEFGWIPVSMRDDFKTIYGDRVTREK